MATSGGTQSDSEVENKEQCVDQVFVPLNFQQENRIIELEQLNDDIFNKFKADKGGDF